MNRCIHPLLIKHLNKIRFDIYINTPYLYNNSIIRVAQLLGI